MMTMLKKILKDFIFIFLTISVFTLSIIDSSYALVDVPTSTRYKVKVADAENQFESSLRAISPLVYNGSNVDPNSCYIDGDGTGCKISGDLAIELTNPYCLGYIALYSAVMYAGNATVRVSATIALLAATNVIYFISLGKYYDLQICGADWLIWGSSEDADISALQNIKEYYPEKGEFKNSRKYQVDSCLKDISKCDKKTKSFLTKDGNRTSFNINDRIYREKLYGGEEVVNNACKDPRDERKNYDASGSGQLYYMRGYDVGNYACDRFLIHKKQEGDKFDEAYQCCVKTSNSVCIKDSAFNNATFCNIKDRKCWVNGVQLAIFKGDNENNKYCAKTFSLCPYNFNIQKGSQTRLGFKKTINKDKSVEDECYDAKNDKSLPCQNRIKNFYQHNRHCTITEEWTKRSDEIGQYYPPFIDKACMNFVGSSHNTKGYSRYNGYMKMFNEYKSFTAPMSECIFETMKNFVFNRTGHTKCLEDNENPDIYGNCISGFKYKSGEDLNQINGTIPPSVRLLKYIRTLILLALTIMIILYGYNILINTGEITRKDMMIMLIKATIVLAFSSGFWWHSQLFNFVYGFSTTMSNITGKMGFDTTKDAGMNYIKYDGCYFGNIKDVAPSNNGEIPNIENNNYFEYPSSRRYLAFFDALDCKITKYLGYNDNNGVPNLIRLLAMAFIWPFNIGLFVAVGTLMMALFVINFAIKAVYIFTASSIAIAVFLYVSPIMIPCILFKKTKGIFDKWLKNLLSFALQPMILFAFVSMSLTIMDKYALGEGIMTGSGPNRELVCGYSCIDSKHDVVSMHVNKRGKNVLNNFTKECGVDNTVVDLKRNSVLCFMDNIRTSNVSLLQPFALFIPMIKDIFLSDVIMFLRVAFLFFILTKVLDTIPSLSAALTGGFDLPTTKIGDPFSGGKKIFGFVRTVRRGSANAISKITNSVKGSMEKKKQNNDSKTNGDGNE